MADLNYSGFSGMDNLHAADRLPDSAVVLAVDGYFDGTGLFVQRPGMRSLSNAPAHSLWSGGDTTLLVSGGALCALVDDALLPLADGFGDQPVCYVARDGAIYLSNGQRTGMVRNLVFSSWGIPAPVISADVTGGALPAGAYTLHATWSMPDGSESGASQGVTATIGTPSGFIVRSDPAPLDAVLLNVYVTVADGTVPYLAASVPARLATCSVLAPAAMGGELQTLLCGPATPADAVGVFGPSLATGHQDGVRFSRAYQPSLFHPFDHLATAPVTCLAGLDGGMLVCTTEDVQLVSGGSVSDLSIRPLRGIGCAKQNPTFCDAGQIAYVDGYLPRGVLLICADGVVHIDHGGNVTPLTQSKMRFPAASCAAGALAPLSGGLQFVFSLQE